MKPLVIVGGVAIALIPWFSGGSDPVAVLISVFGLTISLFLLVRHTDSPRVASLPLRILTTLWLGWAALSLTWSVNRFQTDSWLLYALIAVLVFAAAARLTFAQKTQLLAAYIWVATAAAIYGLYLYFTGDYGRLTSSFYWANPCAAYLAPATILLAWRWITEPKPTWPTALLAAQTLIVAVSLWLTDSRGAILATAVVVGLALSAQSVRRRIMPLFGIVVVTFVLSLGVAALRTHFTHTQSITPGSRFAAAAAGESTSISDRINYLKSSFYIWKDHPILGTGAGTFATVHPQYQQRVISASSNAHNFFAQTVAEQGVVGILILIYLLVVLAIGVMRGSRREPLFIPVTAAAVVLLLHLGLDIDDRYPSLIALLAALLGVVYEPWHHWRLRSAQRASLFVLVGLALILSISIYRSNVAYQNGIIYDGNHQLSQAAASYAAAHTSLAYNPDAITAEGIDYYTLASITGGSKHYTPPALAAANQAIKASPKESQNYLLLGRIQALGGHTAAAIATDTTALRLDRWNHPDYYVDLAALYLKEGNTVAAQRMVSQGLALYPDSVIANRATDATVKPAIAELLALQAADLQQRGQLAATQRDLARATRLDPNNVDVKLLESATPPSP